MINQALFTSNSDEWGTPLKLFDELNKEFHFTLDPCASCENHKCDKYYTAEDDGLKQSWKNEVVFCNPPYSKIKEWVKKCYDEYIENGTTVVLLIPARTDTTYFHNYIYGFAELRFIKGRLHFNESKNSAPFPSMLCVFREE